MAINPVKSLKNSILDFQRYFYDPDAQYTNRLLEKWLKGLVQLGIEIFINGFIFWLVLLSIISIFSIKFVILGPGAWHLLNILELGVIIWFFEEMFKFIMGGYKK